jgi:Rrf2 family protein
MKIINKHSDYAIRAIVYLAKNRERFVPSSEIAKKERIPLVFLRRILQGLIKNKIAVSKEGVSGGVKLIKQPERITAAEIINIFQGEIELIECMFRKHICHNRSKCLLRKKVLEIESTVVQALKKITINDLISER